MTRSQVAKTDSNSVRLMDDFRSVAHAVHNRTNARLSEFGLSLARYRVLSALRAGQMRMNELSSALGVVPRTVTTIIDSMEKEDLLIRLPDEADRRATLLEITREGRHQLSRLHTIHEATAAEVFDVLTAKEKLQLATILRRLQAAATVDASVNPSASLGVNNLEPKKPSSK
jgi:DNA-binding MarR family transcriptional regulator